MPFLVRLQCLVSVKIWRMSACTPEYAHSKVHFLLAILTLT